ncbi:hypothetical protein SADUNF_Sadunf17G0125300 [Salix dunnii]|uniref:Uncharacterized protein n=1 Tax=Salix dunnii TaxID=1413687 RepID=A0A835J6X8_9ROSI|nr:hypothetical protein SADUNF_Sadunf17G0125300 [Salix dunnii]
MSVLDNVKRVDLVLMLGDRLPVLTVIIASGPLYCAKKIECMKTESLVGHYYPAFPEPASLDKMASRQYQNQWIDVPSARSSSNKDASIVLFEFVKGRVKRFHEQPQEAKAELYSRDPKQRVKLFYGGVVLTKETTV